MITPQDYERLSAYQDGQLSPADRARLEARLAGDSELRAALADFRLNRRLLRDLPALKPPRSFTLTAAQAQALGRPRRGGWFPVFRLASALAALALVVVAAGDFGGAWLSGRAAMPAQAPAAEKAAAPTEAAAAEAAMPAAAPTEETAAPAVEADAQADLPTPSLDAFAALAQNTSTPEARLRATETPPSLAAGQAGEATSSATPAPMGTQAQAVEAPPETATTDIPSATPAADDASARQAETGSGTAAAPEAARPALAPVRYLEIGLAGLAIVLALAAWWTRRR